MPFALIGRNPNPYGPKSARVLYGDKFALRKAPVTKNENTYLVWLIRSYLDDRWVCYANREGEERRLVDHGVPQGSVLGPTLWVVLVGGRRWYKTLRNGEIATACAIRALRRLGLRVSPAKSEAIWFYDKNRQGTPPPGLSINMAGETVGVGSRMKYLGLVINSQWTSEPHFDSLIPKVSIRRPTAASSPSQRSAIRRGDSPPLTPNSTVRETNREQLGLAWTRGRGNGVQQKDNS